MFVRDVVNILKIFLFLCLFFVSSSFSLDNLIPYEVGSSGDGSKFSLVVGPGNQPAAVYYNHNLKSLMFGYQTKDGWKKEVVQSEIEEGSFSLVFIGKVPHVLYSLSNGKLKHAYKYLDTWSTEVLSLSNLFIEGDISSVRCGEKICASIYDGIKGDLYFLKGDENGWSKEVVESGSENVGRMNAISVNSFNNPVIAFLNENRKALSVASRKSNGAWIIDELSYIEHHFGVNPSIFIDKEDTIHISASRVTSSKTAQDVSVYYIKKEKGGEWLLSEALTNYAGGDTSISVSPEGVVYLSNRYLQINDIYGNQSAILLSYLDTSGSWVSDKVEALDISNNKTPTYGNIVLLHDSFGDIVLGYTFLKEDLTHSFIIRKALDSDLDGISDYHEKSSNTDFNNADSDFDGLSDGLEVTYYNTNPNVSDSDFDGIKDGYDNCPSIKNENQKDSDSDGIGDLCDSINNDIPDSDNNNNEEDDNNNDVNDPTNSDSDLDSDSDGLLDKIELVHGTNPYKADTDDDGIKDGQEIIDGSNPLDRGSNKPVLDKELCVEWNGFLGGMYNIFELVNLSSKDIKVNVILYSIKGEIRGYKSVSIAKGAERDVLVHDMPGRILNSYGKVCARHNLNAGDLDGRMVYYKHKILDRSKFDFAFSLPVSNGIKGEQFVPFNTYQPSLSSYDQNKLVANWLQITNLEKKEVRGKLITYGQNGNIISNKKLKLPKESRVDIAGHEVGKAKVGLVSWVPDNPTSKVLLRNVRYLYDNTLGLDSFSTAYQVPGRVGSGEMQSVFLNTINETSILEITNTKNVKETADVSIYTKEGELVKNLKVKIPSYGTRHIILDDILGKNEIGVATIKAKHRSSLISIAMHYGRRKDGSIYYMYGAFAKESLGSVFRGSYNTFLNQNSELVIVNPTNKKEEVSISLTRSSGQNILNGSVVKVPAKGVISINLSNIESRDTYGVVSLQPKNSNSINSWVLRRKEKEYVIPTPVRE